jgi:hypothetical protein
MRAADMTDDDIEEMDDAAYGEMAERCCWDAICRMSAAEWAYRPYWPGRS